MSGIDWSRVEPSEALAELMRQDREREPDAPSYTGNGPTEAINGHLEHLRGSAPGFR
ncbi:MAG TPA: hypothetical protein VFR44_11460 [Actinomycetota bacterium]|nr:hypothetical protein [Actinomycetota bacterium]